LERVVDRPQRPVYSLHAQVSLSSGRVDHARMERIQAEKIADLRTRRE
jgi:hypothetical protein